MAAIARGEGEPDHVIRGWLARALGAPRNDATDSEISHAAMLPLLVEPTPPPEAETEENTAPEAEPEPDDSAEEAIEEPDIAAIRPDMAQEDVAAEGPTERREATGT